MKKVKISIPEEDFGTLNTKYPADSSKVSNDSFTAGTKNIETSVKGVITKRKGGVTYSTLPTPPRDQYEAIFSDGVRHLLTVDNGNLRYTSGDGNETLVLAGLTATLNNEFATTQDRVYFGNGIQKKVYDKQTNYGGQPYTFPTQTTKNMGAQAPSAALSGVGAGSGSGVAAGSYKYKVTFVYYDSEESNGGPESTVVTIGAPQDISLSSIPLGGYGVTQRKIYRASSTDSYTQYLLVAVISNNTATTTTDSTGTGLTSIPIDQGLPPDFTLISLYLDRLFVAGVAGDPYFIFYSEPGLPDIYPALNYIPCNQEDPITGIVVYLDRLIVFNRRSMGQILGKTSDQFRYAPIQGSIGCVDNRTIQTRVIDGVPVLVWLSDKGFYAYNGNSIVYISDAIEDQVNSNIQQSVIQKNRISHSDYAIFTAGTWSDGANPFTSDQTKGGINLEANQGTITTKGPYWDTGVHPLATYEEQTNPKKVFDTEDEWDDGTTKTNLAIYDLPIPFTDKMFPTRSAELNFSNGQHVGTYVDGIALKLTLPTLLSSETSSLLGGTSGFGRKYANRFIASASGVVTEASLSIFATPYSYEVWSSHPTTKMPLAALGTVGTVYVTAGQSYWIVANFFSDFSPPISLGNGFPSATTSLKGARLSGSGAGTWISDTALEGSYTIRSSGGPISGTWTSEILDSHALSAPTVLYQTASFPSGTGSVIAVQGSSDPLFNTIETSQQFNNQTTFIPLSLANKRYWRVVISLSSSTAGSTPTVQPTNGFSPGRVELEFPQTGTWESEVIDCTSDVSVYSALTTSSFAPGGFLSTSVTTKIATSTSPAGPWTFVTFGSHTVRQYVKLQIVMTKGRIAPSSTIYDMYPYINSLSFSWTVASTFISDEIDTGSTPSGWRRARSSSTTQAMAVKWDGATSVFWRYPTLTRGRIPASYRSSSPRPVNSAVTMIPKGSPQERWFTGIPTAGQ